MTKKVRKKRTDLLLAKRGLAESREQAQVLIMEGLVFAPSGRLAKASSSLAEDEMTASIDGLRAENQATHAPAFDLLSARVSPFGSFAIICIGALLLGSLVCGSYPVSW